MRAPDSEYNPHKWQANGPERRRSRYTRWVLLVGLLLVLAVPVIAMLEPGSPDRLLPNVAPLSMLLIVGTATSPFAQNAFMTERGLATYREAERAALLTAMRWAFLADILLVAGTFVWLAVAQTLGWPLPHQSSQWTAVGFTLVIAMAMLPMMLAEFIVPMPDDENQII